MRRRLALQQHRIVSNDVVKENSKVQQLPQGRQNCTAANKTLSDRIEPLEKEKARTHCKKMSSSSRRVEIKSTPCSHVAFELKTCKAENDRLKEQSREAAKADTPLCGDYGVPAKLEQAICPTWLMPAEEGSHDLEEDHDKQSRNLEAKRENLEE